MSTTIKEQLQILEETKAQIKQALIDKKIEVIDTDSFRSYADKIDDYTSDATAVISDIAEDKIVYVKGEKIIGNLWTIKNGAVAATGTFKITAPTDATRTNFWAAFYPTKDTLARVGSVLQGIISAEQLIEVIGLTADKIVTGNTILGIEGTGAASEDLQAQLDAQDALIAEQAAQIEELKSLIGDKASNISSETIETVNEILGNEEV